MAYYPDYSRSSMALYRDYVPWHTPYNYPVDTISTVPTTSYVTEYIEEEPVEVLSEPVSDSSRKTIIESYDMGGGRGSGWCCPCSPRTCCLISAGLLGLLLPVAILLGALLPNILNQDSGIPGSNGGTVVRCGTEVCPSNSRCMNILNEQSCQCNSGYGMTASGFCVVSSGDADVNYCADSPCENGGGCESFATGYVCKCPDSYFGIRCQTLKTSCSNNPCKNGGVCTVIDSVRFSCNCTEPYIGDTCELQSSRCDVNPCKHGGTCVDNAYADVLCQCPTGYAGYRCKNILPPA